MNEPHTQTAKDWWAVAGELTRTLRAQKINNRLLVPGTNWTGAHSWYGSGNAAEAEKFTDPGNNFAFEVHQYLDSDSSGTKAACKPGAATRVDAVIKWAESRKVNLFVGEMGGSGDPSCAVEYPAMIAALNKSPAVIAWTAWGGGKWWAESYIFRMAPTKAGDTAHTKLLLSTMGK
jgi:endoglucanase